MEYIKPKYILPDMPDDEEKRSKGLVSGEKGKGFSEKLSDSDADDAGKDLVFISQNMEGTLQEADDENKEQEIEKLKKRIMEEYGLTWEEYAEKEEAGRYNEYLKYLRLSEDDIKKGKVLDVGAGERFFASYCLKNGINDNVYSLEPGVGKERLVDIELRRAIWNNDVEEKINSKTVIASAESIPFADKTFDLIVSHCAMPGISRIYSPDMSPEEIVEADLDEIVRVLKSGGEARLFPLVYRKDGEEDEDTGIILRKLKKMSEVEGLEISWDEVTYKDEESEEHVVSIKKKMEMT